MRKRLATVLLASAVGAFGGITTVTFNGFGVAGGDSTEGSPGTSLNGVNLSGAVFSVGAGDEVFITNSTFRTPDPGLGFDGNYLGFNEIPYFNHNGMLTITFTGGAFAQSITINVFDTEGDNGPGQGVLLELFDGLTFLGSVDTSNMEKDFVNFGWILGSNTVATHLKITSLGGDGYVADNLSFTLLDAEIPEPGTFGLLGLALLGLGVTRRRN
jgi:hypothetical protein